MGGIWGGCPDSPYLARRMLKDAGKFLVIFASTSLEVKFF